MRGFLTMAIVQILGFVTCTFVVNLYNCIIYNLYLFIQTYNAMTYIFLYTNILIDHESGNLKKSHLIRHFKCCS